MAGENWPVPFNDSDSAAFIAQTSCARRILSMELPQRKKRLIVAKDRACGLRHAVLWEDTAAPEEKDGCVLPKGPHGKCIGVQMAK